MSGADDKDNNPANLGQIVIASEVIHTGPSPRRARSVIILLAVSVGLMMTGFGGSVGRFVPPCACPCPLGGGLRTLVTRRLSVKS